MKICFLGAGSTVFAKNVLGDCILTESLGEFDIALHDIDPKRLDESYRLIQALNKTLNGKATITKSLDRKEALRGADFIVNAIQVGGYKPCTVTDFRIPRRYGLMQTIGDTLGIGGISRAMRTIPVLDDFARDIEEVCPNAYFLNYTNPMAMLTGYMLKYTNVKVVGLCHSVQHCVPRLLGSMGMKELAEGCEYTIYGINHQAWLLDVKDKDGNDLYPMIKEFYRNQKFSFKNNFFEGIKNYFWYQLDKNRHEIMDRFGYYITESSEHTSEYLPYFIKKHYPLNLFRYRLLIDDYLRRCRYHIHVWKKQSKKLLHGDNLCHTRSNEYGSRIIEALYTGKPYSFHGSVLNTDGLIPNLPRDACVEVPIVADGTGFHPIPCEPLPTQCAALNRTNINLQLMAVEGIRERDLDKIKMATALDPHAGAELILPQIWRMVDALYARHRKDGYLPVYKNSKDDPDRK